MILDQDFEATVWAAVWIAPDLTHLAYFNQVADQENLYELHVAGIDMSNDQTLFQGDATQVVWAP